MAIGLDLDSFAAQTLGVSYGTPPPVMVTNSGKFIGQCVSYCRQYMEAVLGVKSEVYGNAVDWWTNPKVLALFDRIPKGQERDGDIAVWGDDPGSFTGKEGHDGIWYKGKILNQNYNGSLKVSINDFFPQGYLGALRLKGGNMPDYFGSKEELAWSYRDIYGSEPSKKWIDDTWNAKGSYKDVTEGLKNYAAQTGINYPKYKEATQKEIADLKKQIEQGSGDFIPVGELFIRKDK